VSLEDLIISIFLKVSEKLKAATPFGGLRRCGVKPRLSDEEALTIGIVGEHLGLGSDKRIWEYFKTHWGEWFPGLGSRTGFVRQEANLLGTKREMLRAFSAELTAGKDLYLFDGFPIPVVHIRRYKRSKSALRADGAVGYCAAKSLSSRRRGTRNISDSRAIS
jgi:hypothetical protein